MAVQNLIGKVQKRNRALVKFDPDRICKAILRAAGADRVLERMADFWRTDG